MFNLNWLRRWWTPTARRVHTHVDKRPLYAHHFTVNGTTIRVYASTRSEARAELKRKCNIVTTAGILEVQ